MKSVKVLTPAGVLGLALLMLGIGVVLGTALAPTAVVAQNGNDPIQTITDFELVYADIYETVSPSVVSIEVAERQENGAFRTVSGGSGFVVDTVGHIVTNFHVVEGADRLAVNFVNGIIVRAAVVGLDPDSDLAVIRVNLPPDELRPIQIANSNDLSVGQTTLALGSPFGERWTLTSGIVSALDRTIEGLTNFRIGAVIQTDAAINPGNSGGPLLNLKGELVGVNTQILSRSGTSAGVGFAIPSNLVQRVVPELIQFGRVYYSYLGIDAIDINIDVLEIYGLPNNTRGVVITDMSPNSPAAQAGLRPVSANGVDIVVAVDGEPVYNLSMLTAYIAGQTRPGQTVIFTVLRNGGYVDVPVLLGERA